MPRVIIVGGGPAGSTMGWYLSRAGIDNVIIESANHPRPHVGESMVTATTRIFDEMGLLPQMEAEGFVHKYGAAWHPPDGGEPLDIQFREFPQPGVFQEHTYHVDRSRFDLMLLKHAEEAGSQLLQGVRVNEVCMEGDRAVGVVANVAGERVRLAADVVVDASGRGAVLGRQLGLFKKDPIFDQYAVHAWFEGVDRSGSELADNIHIYFLPVERGWAWQIPISETVTSMGIVTEKKTFREMAREPEAYFAHHQQSSPALAKAMAGARRINEFKAEGDYSYSMDRFVGDGWMLTGDAARFVDPIFSSGVSVAMHSAKFASEALIDAAERGDFSRPALEPYEVRIRRGVEVWYEFIQLYYRLLPLFTVFIQSKKHRQGVLRLLQGDVYDRQDVPVLEAMRKYIETVESSDSHIFKAYLKEVG